MNNLIDTILSKYIEKRKQQNWVISPIGFDIITTLLSVFSNEESQKEFLKILNIKEEELADHIQQLSKILENKSGNTSILLSSKTNIKHTNHYEFNEKLLESIKQLFELDLIEDEGVSPFIEIINDFKFSDKWRNDYSKRENIDIFTNGQGEKFGVQLIGRENTEAVTFDKTYYFETSDFQAIRLPLKMGHFFEMYLPKRGEKLIEISKSLDYNELLNYDSNFKEQEYYSVFFPMFSIENELHNVEKIFKEIGVNKAFNDWNSFNYLIANNYPFKALSIDQNVKIEVDEYGIKAEASTILRGVGSIPKAGKYIVFKANKPFLFLIREAKANNVLLLGSYFQPTEKEGFKINDDIIKMSEAEEIFNEHHLKLENVNVRAKLALCLECFQLMLDEKREKHIFYDNFIENIWRIVVEDDKNWLEDKQLKTEISDYGDFLLGYVAPQSLSHLNYDARLEKNTIFIKMIDDIARIALDCFLDFKYESMFGRKPCFHFVINNLQMLILNSIPLPDLKPYLKYRGKCDELGAPILREAFN